jgi:hypothetical protein
MASDGTYTPGEPVHAPSSKISRCHSSNRIALECHDNDTHKGDLNLLELSDPWTRRTPPSWKSVWAQVALEEMPPKKRTSPSRRPAAFLRLDRRRVATRHEGQGRLPCPSRPEEGELRRSRSALWRSCPRASTLTPTSSPARIWRVTPQEHITRLNELINTEPVLRSRQARPAHPRRCRSHQPRRRVETLLRHRPHHQCGGRHGGLCHGGEERASRAVLGPQTRS